MALTYCVLGSGSSGNCLWVRGAGTQILVDCGISARQIRHRLEMVGGNLADIQAVVCTHGHGDHVAGASVLARHSELDIWTTPGTRRFLPSGVPTEKLHELPVGGKLTLGRLELRTVPTPHDSPQSIAFVISDGEASLGVVTDLGIATQAIAEAISGVEGLVLEMNHDEQMLADGPYPPRLKRRIRGNYGHLSNNQGAELLARTLHPGLQHVTLAHISEHNNTPDLARAVAEQVLEKAGSKTKLAIGEHYVPGEPIELRVGRGRQLSLPLR
jgi:phosphoribosyl 1,2-cyclic phosphodiesterase